MTDQNVNDRLLRLERQNRMLRILVAGAVLVVCIAALFQAVPVMRAAEAETAKSLEAEQFVVRDSRGNGRVFIGVTADGPMFEFRDTRGKTRMSLAMEKDDVLLSVYDSRAMAADSRGRLQARVMATRTGLAVGAYDSGTLTGSVVVKPAKTGTTLVLEDAGGKAVWSAPPPATGTGK
ncbi:MAG TPA: hypothetical protein VM223_23140 [Planctomycetota bacterium]|nr:hypothetical protein [Planctomycetota bacterium]